MSVFEQELPARCLELLFLAVAVCRAAFQLFDAGSEYNARSFIVKLAGSEWWLHNDEKTILPDSRALHLRGCGAAAELSDYGPWPVSSAFGIACTALNCAGFLLFGLNSRGLRAPYILAAAAADSVAVLLFFSVLPLSLAAFASFMTLFNYRQFLASRHAYPELIGLLAGLSPFAVYALFPGFFMERLGFLGAAFSVMILVKPNLAVYSFASLGAVALFGGAGLAKLAELVLFSLAGVLFFEGAQALALARRGILSWRYKNFVTALGQHSGGAGGTLVRAKPPLWRVLPAYCDMLRDWFDMPKAFGPLLAGLSCVLILLHLAFACCRSSSDVAAQLGDAMLLFLVFFLFVSSFLFFYLKRAFQTFPIALCLLLICLSETLSRISSPLASAAAGAVLLALAVLSVVRQARRLLGLTRIKTGSLAEKAEALQRLLPQGAVVYAHCFAYRWFWQAQAVRFISCDDQFMDNRLLLEKAVKEGASYALLSSRGGPFSTPEGAEELAVFIASPCECDYPDSFKLLKLRSRA